MFFSRPQAIDKADRTPKDELDEEELVKTVRPLIEEGSRILQEANGVIRGLDPDGRISANAKHKTAAREASPEEYRLADLLKEVRVSAVSRRWTTIWANPLLFAQLTTHVTQTIENGKKKIEGMPHAKKELNPLWGLLSGLYPPIQKNERKKRNSPPANALLNSQNLCSKSLLQSDSF